jgi:hypothetical protein
VSPASPLRRWLLAAPLALAACGSSHHGQVADVADKRGHSLVGGSLDLNDLRLLDAGEEPRAPLRYRLTAGSRESLVLELSNELKLAVGDMNAPVRSPLVRVTIDVAVKATGARLELEGTLLSLAVPDDPAIAPRVVTALRSDLERLAGTAWTASFSDRGELLRVALPAPADANTQVMTTLGQIRDAIRLLLPPLPEPPVGTNARWQVRRRALVATAHVEERTIYKLESTEAGPQLSLGLGMDARAQPLMMPGTPPGTTTALTSFEGGGKGQVELALTRVGQPTTMRWSAMGRGTSTPGGEPPLPFTLTLNSAISVKRR